MSATATIRVPEATRDQLAELAGLRGLSISNYVTELARQQSRAEIIAAARAEAQEFEENLEAQAEFALWEGTVGDGID